MFLLHIDAMCKTPITESKYSWNVIDKWYKQLLFKIQLELHKSWIED